MPSVIIEMITIPLMTEPIVPQEHTHILRACVHFQQGKIKLYTAISKIQQIGFIRTICPNGLIFMDPHISASQIHWVNR